MQHPLARHTGQELGPELDVFFWIPKCARSLVTLRGIYGGNENHQSHIRATLTPIPLHFELQQMSQSNDAARSRA